MCSTSFWRNTTTNSRISPTGNIITEQNTIDVTGDYFRIKTERTLEEIPRYSAVLERFINNEIITLAEFCQEFEVELRQSEAFSTTEAGEKRWSDLKSRIVEHNIRMMAKYYTKIRLTRMSKLLALTETETEDCLSDMVVAGTVSAKTDRLEGIVDFTEQEVGTFSRNISCFHEENRQRYNQIPFLKFVGQTVSSRLKSWSLLPCLEYFLGQAPISFDRKASRTVNTSL